MKITTKEIALNLHTINITLIHYTDTTVEFAWDIDGSYDRVELTTEEKATVKSTIQKVVSYLSSRTNLFVELYTEDGAGDMRRHLHSKWGFSSLGCSDYMILGDEDITAAAIGTKLSMQVG